MCIWTQCCAISLFYKFSKVKTIYLTPRVSLSFSQKSCSSPNGTRADQPLQHGARVTTRSKAVWNGAQWSGTGESSTATRGQINVLCTRATGRGPWLANSAPHKDLAHTFLEKRHYLPSKSWVHPTQLRGGKPHFSNPAPSLRRRAPGAVVT